MSNSLHAGVGTVLMTGLVAILEYSDSPVITTLFLIGVLGLIAASVIMGQKLPLTLKIVATGLTVYLGYGACLVGRTEEPGLTAGNLKSAVGYYFLVGLIPTVGMLRIWKKPISIKVTIAMLPICLLSACIVAGFEERQFVRQHQEGIGTTARWTVSNHWLAYDSKAHRLYGSD